MPKEWTGPSDYFAAGLFANQNRKAVFRSVLTPEGQPRGFSAMEFEEAAADLSLKKVKTNNYESREKTFESREKTFPSSYGLDESMDLSTKWRAPPAKPSTTPHADPPERTLDKQQQQQHKQRSSKSSPHVRMLPRKRLHESAQPPCTSPDVIVLSDEERPRLNGHSNGYNENEEPPPLPPPPEERLLSPEEVRAKRRLFARLRDDLRAEEMKLVLMKKVHQSQAKENYVSPAAGKLVPSASRGGVAPPPLVRSGGQPQQQQQQGKLLGQQLSSHQSSLLNSSLLCNQNTHGGPPPLIGQRGNNTSSTSSVTSSLMSSLMRSSHNASSRTPVTTPPNMVMGYNLHNLQQSVQSNQHQISMNQANPQACPSPSLQSSQLERMENQTPAQRQAAAKLALRKQLEKTLLQIPPPKPPPPEMHFVPNANNQEFVCLLGLEKAVDLLTEDPSIHRPPPEPFECVQCGTDFSPVWKWQDAGRPRHNSKPSVICETCVTSNIKKALKAEHTNRLKTAFVKALQQEQEIEQRMSMPSPPGLSPTHTPCSTPTPTAAATPPAQSHSPAPSKAPPSNLLQHLPKLSAAHQSLLHAQAQLQHFAQPQPAHMYPFAPLLAAQAYSYQLLGKNPMTSADLQRQYLLDMIPPRSLPQGSMNWKT